MRRFLQSQLDKPWDHVYSKICRMLAMPIKKIDDLHDVELHVVIDNEGQLVDARGMQLAPGDFYVHPETGALMQVPIGSRRRYQRRKSYLQLLVNDGHRYVRIKRIWYDVEFASLPADVDRVDDVVLGEKASFWALYREWDASLYAVSKRQLNKRELREIHRTLNEEQESSCNKCKGHCRANYFGKRKPKHKLTDNDRRRKQAKESGSPELRLVHQNLLAVPFQALSLH
jgi:hypothetical protein